MTQNTTATPLHPHELEQASNSYLMAIVAVIAGLPLPIINTIASLIYYLSHKNSSYFVRWHCIQSILSQAVMIPFNSIAFAWTIKNIYNNLPHGFFSNGSQSVHLTHDAQHLHESISLYYFAYIALVIVLNIVEFAAVIATAAEVRKGKNVRWFFIANLTDALTSKTKHDPYTI